MRDILNQAVLMLALILGVVVLAKLVTVETDKPAPGMSLQTIAFSSTVKVARTSRSGAMECSGTIIGKTRIEYKVLTAAHCVGDIDRGGFQYEFKNGRTYLSRSGDSLVLQEQDTFKISGQTWDEEARLELVGNLNAGHDYALMAFTHADGLVVAKMNALPLELGEQVVGVSIPLGWEKIYLTGQVARTGLSSSVWRGVSLVQIPGVERGSSGSAIFDLQGRVRGVLVAQVPDNRSIAVAIPISEIFLEGK